MESSHAEDSLPRPTSTILGVDIGTTSVKTVVVNNDGCLLKSVSRDTHAYIKGLPADFREQDAHHIVSSLQACLDELSEDLLRKVTVISICGQMHGVIMWKASSGWSYTRDGRLEVRDASHLVTWEDGRCTRSFIASLPKSSHVACPAVSSGHGCATLMWLSKYDETTLNSYNRAGTIMDYIVAALCGLDRPLMSDQNASSWGYCHGDGTVEVGWDEKALSDTAFPFGLLPRVVNAGLVAGFSQQSFCGIPPGAVVLVALGDMQCSVRATGKSESDGVLNIGTSAQLSVEVEDVHLSKEGIEFRPYFKGAYLAVAASLNGGNALATFVDTISMWMSALGCSTDVVDRHKDSHASLWERLIELALDAPPSATDGVRGIRVCPRLLGERHAPHERGSVHGLDGVAVPLGTVFRAYCAGLVSNVLSMMGERQGLSQCGVTRLLCVGGALRRNAALRQEVERQFAMPVLYPEQSDAAYGAALVAVECACSVCRFGQQ